MEGIPDSDKEYQRQIYDFVDEITRGLTGEDRETLSDELEQEYGIDFYPVIDPCNSGNDYMRTSFGLSGFLADYYSRPQDPFFDERNEDFTAFIEELGEWKTGYGKPHLVQYARLYSEIADEEGLDFDHPVDVLILKSTEEAREHVWEMFNDLSSQI